eukprot:GHVO01031322.1.p2 GENE.GHVO01031322.1~~GHVO01031322.1.p2  ORF type:complete len:127 (-),score=7.59 GHVO01031322.1:405-785(-)
MRTSGEQLVEKKNNQAYHHDRTAGPTLAPLYPGQAVRTLEPRTGTWQPATVIDRAPEPRSYNVETQNGTEVRRNRAHLRPAADEAGPPVPVDVDEQPDDDPPERGNNPEGPYVTRFGRTIKPPQRF